MMILSSLLTFVLLRMSSQSTVDGFSPIRHPASTPKTINRLLTPITTSKSARAFEKKPIRGIISNDAFDSAITSRTESSNEKGLYGIAFPMAMAFTVSLGMNVNDWIDSFFLPLTESDIEAEVLKDISHLVSDLITIAAPAVPYLPLRLAAVLGRILSIAADYIPDHVILPDELLFQSIMLVFSGQALMQTIQPKIAAAITLPRTFRSIRDGKAYTALFKPTGMTWAQYKTLSACAMDWVDVGPNQEVAVSPTKTDTSMDGDEDDLSAVGNEAWTYWLYRGSMTITNTQGKPLHKYSSTGGGRQLKQNAFRGLFGETNLLQSLEKKTINQHPTRKNSRSASYPVKCPDDSQQELALRAGPSGATFLRIRSSPLSWLTDHDEDLASCLRILLFFGLSSKLDTAAQESEQ